MDCESLAYVGDDRDVARGVYEACGVSDTEAFGVAA